jgi:hypothetical protein
MTHHVLRAAPDSLDADELRIAADVYETVLTTLDRTALDPFRERLARFIIRRLFDGEREPDCLRAVALEHGRRLIRQGA